MTTKRRIYALFIKDVLLLKDFGISLPFLIDIHVFAWIPFVSITDHLVWSWLFIYIYIYIYIYLYVIYVIYFSSIACIILSFKLLWKIFNASFWRHYFRYWSGVKNDCSYTKVLLFRFTIVLRLVSCENVKYFKFVPFLRKCLNYHIWFTRFWYSYK